VAFLYLEKEVIFMRAGRGNGGGTRGGSSTNSNSRSGSGRIGGNSAGRAGRRTGDRGRSTVPASRQAPRRNTSSFGTGLAVGTVVGAVAGGKLSNRNRSYGGFNHGRNRNRHSRFRGTYSNHNNGRGRRNRNSLIALIIGGIVALTIIIAIVFMVTINSTSQVTHSTIRREALPRGLAIDSTPLFTDHLGWIGNQTQLSAGMRNFQNRTGVRPHLYITGDIDGDWNLPTIQELSSFANRRYSELFI